MNVGCFILDETSKMMHQMGRVANDFSFSKKQVDLNCLDKQGMVT